MKSKYGLSAIAAAAVINACSAALAADTEDTVGKNEYLSRCALCHGQTGKGDGWLSRNLIKPPPSITQLKKNNGGVFPMAAVTDVIDGRKAVSSHGPREMPVWGDVYRTEAKAESTSRPAVLSSDEQMARAKIRALANYVRQLQE